MSDDGADIIPLYSNRDADDDQRPVATKEMLDREAGTIPTHCWHRRTVVDERLHRVYCRDCDAEVDAFQVLLDIARDQERLIYRRREAARRAKELEDRVANLHREERNAKARLRRRGVPRDPAALASRWIREHWREIRGQVDERERGRQVGSPRWIAEGVLAAAYPDEEAEAS